MIQRVDDEAGAGAEPAAMEAEGGSRRARCPTCGARRRGDAVCHRCRTDLGLLIAIEAQADRLLQDVLRAHSHGRFRTAMARARALLRLEPSPGAWRLLAASALRAGDFATAVRAARRAGLKASAAPGAD
ncbi:MAG: hypothetical protein HY721_11475 [Planctomycetes bacterium]|nr:hypothetical protein [Planctomycetota bacterium]